MKRNKITNVSGVKLEFFVKREDAEDILVSLEPGSVCFSDGDEMTKSMRIFLRKNLLTIELGDFPVIHGFSDTLIVDLSDYSIIPNASPDNDEILDDLHTTKNVEIKIKMNSSLQEDLEKFHGITPNQFEDMMRDISANEIHMDLFKEISNEAPVVSVDWAMENIMGLTKEEVEKLKKEDELSKISEGAVPTIDQIADPFTTDSTTQTNLLEEAEKQAKDYKEDDDTEKKQYKYNYKKKPGRKKKRGPKPGAKKKKKKLDENKDKDNDENNEQ